MDFDTEGAFVSKRHRMTWPTVETLRITLLRRIRRDVENSFIKGIRIEIHHQPQQ